MTKMDSMAWQFLCGLLVVGMFGMSAMVGAAEIKGSVIAKRSDTVTVEFREHKTSVPKPGDRVTFSKEMFGTQVSAGRGEILSVEGNRAEARIIEGKPRLKVDAVIEASGSVAKVQPRPSPSPVPSRQPAAPAAASGPVDHGWGAAMQQSPEARRIDEILAAKDVCDYQTAEQLGADARVQFPGNAWLQQNYPTLRTLAQRDRNYRQAMRSARLALEANRASDGVVHLQTAMKNASVQCGQDEEVRGLHAEAEQMLATQHAQERQAAQQRAIEQARRDQARMAADERARAKREADALEVQQGLLETMRMLQGGSSVTPAPTRSYQGDDWIERGRPKTENNETWQKWRETQGW